MWTFSEVIDGHELWPRRRALPGPGGLRWHMAAHRQVSPTTSDLGLLTGSFEEVDSIASRLVRMRQASGMRSDVLIIDLGQLT